MKYKRWVVSNRKLMAGYRASAIAKISGLPKPNMRNLGCPSADAIGKSLIPRQNRELTLFGYVHLQPSYYLLRLFNNVPHHLGCTLYLFYQASPCTTDKGSIHHITPHHPCCISRAI
jgi:hypothetical protein